MARLDWSSADINLSRPSLARMYDYNLGGSHNFAIDRRFADEFNRVLPDLVAIHRANRSFLRRVVQFLSSIGIRQFLDLGSGIPTVGNVHEIAQRAVPESRVVYVDDDAAVVTHSNAILLDNDRTAAIRADIREPDRILSDPVVRSLIDFAQPVGLLMFAVLHYLSDEDQPSDIVHTYRDAMGPGSYLAISHGTADGRTGHQIHESVRVGRRNNISATMRGRTDVISMFDGFTIVQPGVVFAPQWRPDTSNDHFSNEPDRSAILAAVGVKRQHETSRL